MHVALNNAFVSGKGEETMVVTSPIADVVSKLRQELMDSRKEIAKNKAEIKNLEKVRITKKLCASFHVLEEERLRLKEENELYKQRLTDAEEVNRASYTAYSSKVDALLDQMKAEMNEKDNKIVSLTKEMLAALHQVEEMRTQMKKESYRNELSEHSNNTSPSPAAQLQEQVKELKAEVSKRDGRIIRLTVALSSALDKVEEERAQLIHENESYRMQLADFQDETFCPSALCLTTAPKNSMVHL